MRLLRETNSTALSPSTVYYAAPEAPFVLQHASSWYSVVPTILTASLAASGTIKNGTVDLWNHHKVPRLRAVESAKVSSTDENQHWVPVNNDTKLDYSSWTGVNAQGLEPGKHSEFRVKYNYLAVDCTLSVRDKPIAVLDHLRQPSTYIYSKFPSKNSTTSQETNSAYSTLLNSTLFLQGHDIRFESSYFLKYGYNITNSSNSQSNNTSNSKKRDTKYVPILIRDRLI